MILNISLYSQFVMLQFITYFQERGTVDIHQ